MPNHLEGQWYDYEKNLQVCGIIIQSKKMLWIIGNLKSKIKIVKVNIMTLPHKLNMWFNKDNMYTN